MSLQSLFIYKVITGTDIYIIIARNPAAARVYISAHPETIITTVKLGCVTADVADNVEPGIVNREWRSIE